MKEDTANLNLNGPKELIDAVKRRADEDGLSTNAWCIRLFEDALRRGMRLAFVAEAKLGESFEPPPPSNGHTTYRKKPKKS